MGAQYRGTTKIRDDLKTIVEKTPMSNIQFIGDRILPPTPVNTPTAQIPELTTGTGTKNLDTKRAPSGSFKRGEFTWDASTYYTYEYGYEEPVDNVSMLINNDILNEEMMAGIVAVSQLKIAREVRIAAALFNTTLFTGAAHTEAADVVWSTAANAVVRKDVNDAYEKLFVKTGIPRTNCHLLMNELAFRYAMASTEVRADVKYTLPIDQMSEGQKQGYLATYLNIGGIDIAASFADTAKLGITDATFGRLFGTSYALLYVPTPGIASFKFPGIGRQPVYSKFSNDYILESYPEERTDSIIVRAREYRGEFVDVTYGVLITGII